MTANACSQFGPFNVGLWSHPPEVSESGHFRPATPLQRHQLDVEVRMHELGVIDNDAFVTIIARLHDIGKLTTWFQRHVRDERVHPQAKTHHAHVGAAVADYALGLHPAIDHWERLVGVISILKHHGALPDIEGHSTAFAQQFAAPEGLNATAYSKIDEKLDNIHDHDDARAVAELLIDGVTDGAGTWDDCRETFKAREGLPDLAQYAKTIVATENEFYGRLIDTWTTLTLADTTSAAQIEIADLDCGTLAPDAVSTYIDDDLETVTDGLPSILNDIRTAARQIALDRVTAFVDGAVQVGTITLPTGFGKTLTSTQTALTLAQRKTERTGQPSRVVYALPYTSIIDQTANELDAVYPEAAPRDLGVDHYLADPAPDESDAEADALADRERTLIRKSWRQGFTLTTFVQLFESLAGPNKSQGLKLPALHNAVIILDEPQALPPEWMNLINRLCRVLTECYNAHIIALTATQPKLFELFDHTPEPFALVEADDEAFESDPSPMAFIHEYPRVQYVLHPSADPTAETEPLSPETAATMLCEELSTPTLAICNTIASARTLAQRVQEQFPDTKTLNEQFAAWRTDQEATAPATAAFVDTLDTDEPVLAHLTTRHRPADRLAIIDIVDRLCEQQVPVVLVSTQLVEAGVDISFDTLYRDIAPIPSLVQAAGRCNRSFETTQQDVHIWTLADETGATPPSEMIYARLAFGDPLAATATTLTRWQEEGSIAEETMIGDAVETYFADYYTASRAAATSLPELVETAQCEHLSDRHLIDQTASIDVLVPRITTETAVVEQIAMNDDLAAARDQQAITVSIPGYKTNESAITAIRQQCRPIGEETGLYAMSETTLYDAFLGLAPVSDTRD